MGLPMVTVVFYGGYHFGDGEEFGDMIKLSVCDRIWANIIIVLVVLGIEISLRRNSQCSDPF